MLKRVIKRTRASNGEDVDCGPTAWLGVRLFLFDREPKLDLECRFDFRANDFTVDLTALLALACASAHIRLLAYSDTLVPSLLLKLRWKVGLTYLFISHNLAVVQSFCEHIPVTEAGRCIEDLAAHDAGRNLASRRLLNASLAFFLLVLRFSAL
jgi:hypothetical protein